MPLINSTVLLGLADRVAYQYNILKALFATINATGGGTLASRIQSSNDADVQATLLQVCTAIDAGYSLNQWLLDNSKLMFLAIPAAVQKATPHSAK